MQVITIAQQYTLDGSIHQIRRNKFDTPSYQELRDMAIGDWTHCDNCYTGMYQHGRNAIRYGMYGSPYDDTPNVSTLCSERCEEAYIERDLYCDSCNRTIAEDDGYISHFVFSDSDYECIKCYNDRILESGQDTWEFSQNRPIVSTWDDETLLDHGFTNHQEYILDRFKDVEREYKAYQTDGINLILNGYQVVTTHDYGSTYILWRKANA